MTPLLLLPLLAGCQRSESVVAPETQEKISLRALLEERELVAGWFGVHADAVSLIGEPNHGVPGGDRDWAIRLPTGDEGAAAHIMVITEDGLPALMEGTFPVPQAREVVPPSPPWDALEGQQRAAAEAACVAVARILGLPIRVVQVASVREQGDAGYSVVLHLIEEPWNELGGISVTVMPERLVGQIVFGADR